MTDEKQLTRFNSIDFIDFKIEPRGERIVITFKEKTDRVYYLDALLKQLHKIDNTVKRLQSDLK